MRLITRADRRWPGVCLVVIGAVALVTAGTGAPLIDAVKAGNH